MKTQPFIQTLFRLGILTLALLCAACAVGPDYAPPDFKTPPRFRYAGETPASPPALPEGGWWEIFDDILLNQLIAEARLRNYSLAASAERVRQARAAARIGRSGLFPFLSLDSSMERRKYSENIDGSTGDTVNTFQFPMIMGYELDLFGRIRRGYEANRAEAEAAAEDFNTARLVLETDIAAAYFNMRALDDEIRIVSRAIETRRKQLDILNSRHRHGVISKLPVAQARAELQASEALLFSLQRNRAKQEIGLAVLSGVPPTEISIRPDPLRDAPPAVPPVLPSFLLVERPDIRKAERALAAANARIGVATAAFFPQITLSADAGLSASDIGDLFSGDSFTWGLGPGVYLPVFQGGKNAANLERAKAAHAEALADYRHAVIRALGETEDALVSAGLLKKQAEANRSAVRAALEAYELSRKQFEGGLTNYLSVLDAERTYLETLRLESQLRGLRFVSAVQLVKSVGGKW